MEVLELWELNDEFSEYVTIDGISERKGSDITKKIKKLNDEILAYELKITQINKSIENHNSLEKTSQKKANI